MHSSVDNNTSTCIENALFHAMVQLTVPTVTSAGMITTKCRSNSTTDEPPPMRKSRSRLSLFSISFSKPFHLHKQKLVRDTTPQSIIRKSPLDSNHFEGKMAATILSSSPSNDQLSTTPYYQYSRSTSCSSLKHNRSIKGTIFGICQGSNNNQIPSTVASPMNAKHPQEPTKRATPRWRAFAKVVVSLLAFTRTKKGRYDWIQLVGHPGTFKEGIHDGYVLKELCDYERECCELLQKDILKNFVPHYNGTVKDDEGKFYIEMEDLLASFHEPCIMDCKIGVRTYLEEELDKSERDPKPRADLYDKMVAIDLSAPTDKENEERQILKPRYMIWRESLSSTQDLAFRIEAIKKSRGLMSKEFQRIKERHDVKTQFSEFIAHSLPRATSYLHRLMELRSACSRSKFLQTHELIGSSILFVHDESKASLWMIDFGKTRLLPNNIHITHLQPWIRGSHEDGYLLGLNNLISIFEEIIDELKLSF